MSHKSYANESDIEFQFGFLMDTIFGWHEYEGKQKRQVSVQFGHEIKKADIVLYFQKNPFVIELKGVGISPHTSEINQLKSYMKNLGSEYGMIANDKEMWLYYCPFQNAQMEEYAHIPYDEDDANGLEFASILLYNDYSLRKMDDFRTKMQAEYKDKKLADELMQILCNGDKGKAIISNALLNDATLRTKYTENAIHAAIDKIEFVIKKIPHVGNGNESEPKSEFTGFYKKGLQTGTVVVFKGDPSITATVAGNKELLFEGTTYKTSTLAQLLFARIGKPKKACRGAEYFLYHGIPVLYLQDV